MVQTNWLDPNWRHQLSNAVIAYIVIGILASAAVVAYWAMRHFSLFAVVVAGALIGASTGGVVWTLVQKSKISEQEAPVKEQAPTRSEIVKPEVLVKGSINTSVVSRLHSTAKLRDEPFDMSFEFQELFYEWNLTLALPARVDRIILTLSHLAKSDRVSIVPEDAARSELKAKWISGFDEPTRTPDFYACTLTLLDLPSELPVVIAIRRPLEVPVLAESGIITVAEIRSPSARIELPPYDPKQEQVRLSKHATALANWQWGRKGESTPRRLPLGRDPGDVRKGHTQVTLEGRCEDDECKKIIMKHMTGRIGR
jgi:hypothetical protein